MTEPTEQDGLSMDLAAEPKPRKKRGWLFWVGSGCGCGCLLVLIGLAALGWFFKVATDPDVQWPRLRESLYFDERPAGQKMLFGMDRFGPARFQLEVPGNRIAPVFLVFETEEALRVLMDASSEQNQMMGSTEPLALEVQGRQVAALQLHAVLDTSGMPKWFTGWAELEKEQDLGTTLRVDLSGPGGRWMAFELTSVPGSDTPPTAEDVSRILEPFDVWREP